MTKPPTEAELLEYSDDHVAYEVERFFWLTEVLTDPSIPLPGPSKSEELRFNDALIEAFALHLRNLLEFLYDPKDSHNIIAAQFCDRVVWKLDPEAKPKALRDAWGRSNEQIAHLTDRRRPRDSPDKVWPFKEIADAIKPLIQQFFDLASDKKLSRKVGTAINAKPEKPSADKPVGPAGSAGPQERAIVGQTGTSAPGGER